MSRFKVKDNNDQWVDISANGVGVPSGGNQGQILAKRSGTNYDAGWVNPSGGVHVGPTAPSDAFTTIWLDTDEQGASSVSSVNGKNGTVVLDTVPMTLLWTNASPTSDFAAQTVSLDYSDYDVILMVIKSNTTSVAYFTNISEAVSGRKGFINKFSSTTVSGTAVATGIERQFEYTASGIDYTRAFNYTGNTAVNNEIIPFKIYGIKVDYS